MRKTARTAAHAGALSDLRRHGLAENGGTTTGGETLRNLTVKGLEAAAHELRRPLWEMGGPARGAGSSGAAHALAVNETVIALLRPKPDLTLLAGEPPQALAEARAVVDGPAGIGTIASYATEVPLPATGTWNAPGGAVPRPTSCWPRRRTGCGCCSWRSITATRVRRNSRASWRSTRGSSAGR